MIGKIIGAFVGDKIAKQTSGIGGATGAAIGVLGATALRRLSLPAMIAIGAGGYVAKRILDKKPEDTASDAEIKPAPSSQKAA